MSKNETSYRPHVQWWMLPLPKTFPQNEIDPKKPVRTRDGRAAFILEFDPREEYPILAAVNHPQNRPQRFCENGAFYAQAETKHPSDLFNVTLKTFVIQKDIFEKRQRAKNG